MNVYALRPESITDPLAICFWMEKWQSACHTPTLIWLGDWTQVSSIGGKTVTIERIDLLRALAAQKGLPPECFFRWLALWHWFTVTEQDGSEIIFTDLGIFPRHTPNRGSNIFTSRFTYTRPALIGAAICRMLGENRETTKWVGMEAAKNDIDFFGQWPHCYTGGQINQWVYICGNPLPTQDEIGKAHKEQGP